MLGSRVFDLAKLSVRVGEIAGKFCDIAILLCQGLEGGVGEASGPVGESFNGTVED
jgi:hypothetical protein